jgi:Putative Actinobacterial Holin-X, holin superfamily III
MFNNLAGLIRGDVERQIGWAKRELETQARFTALTAALAAVAALAALGAAVVGLIALYTWLELKYDTFIALGIVGGGLALLAAVLLTVALARRRPTLKVPPPLQSAHPAALIGAVKEDTIGDTAATAQRLLSSLKSGSYGDAVAAGEEGWRTAEDNLRHGSRQAVYATLAIAAVLGILAGRRL